MAKDRNQGEDFSTPLKRLLLGILLLVLMAIFLVWRIDSPRVERFRAQVTDTFVPSFDWAMAPVTGAVNLLRDFQVINGCRADPQMRRELQQNEAWKEAALHLETENARLLDLHMCGLIPPDLNHRLVLPHVAPLPPSGCSKWDRDGS